MTNSGPLWSRLICIFAIGVLFVIYSIAWLQPNWSPPSEDELIKARGKFVDLRQTSLQPYVFQSESGEVIKLGCVPEIRVVDCVQPVANSPALSETVTIGFVKIHTPWWELKRGAWPSVLVTVDANGTPIRSFSQAKDEFQNAYAFHQKSRWMVPAGLLPLAAFCFLASVWAAIKRIKQN